MRAINVPMALGLPALVAGVLLFAARVEATPRAVAALFRKPAKVVYAHTDMDGPAPTRAESIAVKRGVRALLGRSPRPSALAALAWGFDGADVRVSPEGKGFLLETWHPRLPLYRLHVVLRRGGDDKNIAEIRSLILDGKEGTPRNLPHGLGSQLFAYQLAAANKLGLDRFELEAAGGHSHTYEMNYNGHLTWPRFGFDGNVPDALAAPGSPKTVQSFLAAPGGMDRWQAYFRIASAKPPLSFSLRPGSMSSTIWDDYARKKQIETNPEWLRN